MMNLKKIPRRMILVFLGIYLAISSVALWYYLSQKQRIISGKNAELSAIADLKVSQVDHWKQERLNDAAYLVASPFAARAVRAFIADPRRKEAEAELAGWMERVRRNYRFIDIMLFDAYGKLALSVGESPRELGPFAQAYVDEVRQTRITTLSDFYRGPGGDIHLDLITPLMIAGKKSELEGIILIRIDPNVLLYPLVQTWPTPSRTFEIALVRREGPNALFLSELRQRKNTALRMKLPAGEVGLPTAAAVRSREGIFEGKDYRGVKVLSALRSIPGTGWYLVVKQDLEEIYAPLGDFNRFMLISMGLLFIISAGTTLYVWQAKQARALRLFLSGGGSPAPPRT